LRRLSGTNKEEYDLRTRNDVFDFRRLSRTNKEEYDLRTRNDDF